MIPPTARAEGRLPGITSPNQIGSDTLTPPHGTSETAETGTNVRHVSIVAAHDQSFHDMIADRTPGQAHDHDSKPGLRHRHQPTWFRHRPSAPTSNGKDPLVSHIPGGRLYVEPYRSARAKSPDQHGTSHRHYNSRMRHGASYGSAELPGAVAARLDRAMLERDRSIDDLLDMLQSGSSLDRSQLAQQIATISGRAALVNGLLPYPEARRWLRGTLLDRLDQDEAAELAGRLLEWRDDFAAGHRDRTTPAVIRFLPLDLLRQHAAFLAGGNAASAFWERLAAEGSEALIPAAISVFTTGEPPAREATLHLLLLDPYSPLRLSAGDQGRLLTAALNDADEEVRGLAAEMAAETDPDRLLRDQAKWTLDPSERVRMAAWDVAFAAGIEQAAEEATLLLGDEAAPLAARRSALIALGDYLPTPQFAPLLALMVAHPTQELAEDAGDLLWTRHRTPIAAQAAARSPYPAVREIAQWLLHPEFGSPAAGGSRPGAPGGYDIYQEMLKLGQKPEE